MSALRGEKPGYDAFLHTVRRGLARGAATLRFRVAGEGIRDTCCVFPAFPEGRWSIGNPALTAGDRQHGADPVTRRTARDPRVAAATITIGTRGAVRTRTGRGAGWKGFTDPYEGLSREREEKVSGCS